MEKYYALRDIKPHEIALLSESNKCKANILLATLQGEFAKDGRRFVAIIRKHNDHASINELKAQLENFTHYLKGKYANYLLASLDDMKKICAACGNALESDSDTDCCFAAHTERLQFFVRCTPDQAKDSEGGFTIYCYDRQALIASGFETNDKEI